MVKKRTIVSIASKIPSPILNKLFLTFPKLYKNEFVNYEAGTNKKQQNDLINGIIETKDLEGDLIECGSNRCGTTCILGICLHNQKIHKKIFALDTFGGFDPEELKKEQKNKLTDLPTDAYNYNSYDYVKKKLKKLKLDSTIVPIKGYFQETFPKKIPKVTSKFCLGFIDCDLGESITYTAEQIWPKLSSNGIIFFHDYSHHRFQNVKPHVDKFVKKYEKEITNHHAKNGMYMIQKK